MGNVAVCLDLVAIEVALRDVQRHFAEINVQLAHPRVALEEGSLVRILSGYAYIGEVIDAGVDILAPGKTQHLLELNARVLCGIDAGERAEAATHLQATEERFYDDRRGGIRDIVEWYAMHRKESVWQRAAGVYVRLLSRPQLFIEGNHRTGALIMSYLLVREGRPPFVLTVDNAKAYFDPSALITRTKKHSLGTLYRMPKIKANFAEFLKRQASERFLCRSSGTVEPPPGDTDSPLWSLG